MENMVINCCESYLRLINKGQYSLLIQDDKLSRPHINM